MRLDLFLPNQQTSDTRFQSAPLRQRLTAILSEKESDTTFGFFGDSLSEVGTYAHTCKQLLIVEKNPASCSNKRKIIAELGSNNVELLAGYSWPGGLLRAKEVARRARAITLGKIDRLVLDGNSGLPVSRLYINEGLAEMKRLGLLADHIWIGISCLGGKGTRNQIVSSIESHSSWVEEFDKLEYEILNSDDLSTRTGPNLRAVINYEIFEIRRS